ncbi:hypothetical protein QAD02_022543 [Eretmocerus hayati]|uniref:Uncharacterized protein n=1 Tax=Eretmocerus hayati TaxID=131215 RepID=A0ACC2PVT7_9HYME|nr:hypothetical protein QAD02_022543 [Eretmocerus hayati]
MESIHRKIQKVYVEIISIWKFGNSEKKLLNLQQKYVLEALLYNYNFLAEDYGNNQLNTRNKLAQSAKNIKEVWKRSHMYSFIMYFYKLPPDLKNLGVKQRRMKIKEYITKQSLK